MGPDPKANEPEIPTSAFNIVKITVNPKQNNVQLLH